MKTQQYEGGPAPSDHPNKTVCMTPAKQRTPSHRAGATIPATPAGSDQMIICRSGNSSKRRRSGAPTTSTDRYIPNRASIDTDLLHHLIVRGTDQDGENKTQQCETPKKRGTAKRARCLFSGTTAKKACNRLLSFSTKRKLNFSSDLMQCTSPRIAPQVPKITEENALKILDAPGVSKNFYYNLLDWGTNNIVLIGLKEGVYYWDAAKSQAYVLPQEASRDGDLVTSVKWKPDATKHLVSQRFGTTKLWDSTVCKLVSRHNTPTVYSASWQNNNVVTMGRGDGSVLHWDVRTPFTLNSPQFLTSGIICGLEWDKAGESMAVGCNDNKVQIVQSSNLQGSTETLTMVYQSAVKALAWHPSNRGILATGSGQNDQRVVVWDLISGVYRNCIDTKSQVTGVLWAPSTNELVTSHGHFDPNLRLWDMSNNTNKSKLTGHSNMIVSIAKCSMNDQIISLSADESLRVWDIFTKSKSINKCKLSSSLLSLDKIR